MDTTTTLTVHRDHTITYWSVYDQVWERRVDPRLLPDRELSAMAPTDRARVRQMARAYVGPVDGDEGGGDR